MEDNKPVASLPSTSDAREWTPYMELAERSRRYEYIGSDEEREWDKALIAYTAAAMAKAQERIWKWAHETGELRQESISKLENLLKENNVIIN